MSIWDDQFEDYERDKHDFEAWLDSLEGEGTDEEKYDKYQDAEYEKWLENNIDEMAEEDIMAQDAIMAQAEYPEFMVKGEHYIMTVSNN